MKVPLETFEQQQVVNYLRANNYKFTAIPNSTFTKSFAQKRKNKLEGLNAWLPDLCIILKRKNILFLEMKRQQPILKSWKLWKSPSVVSQEQIDWINAINECQWVEGKIAFWAENAIKIIKELENK